MTKDELLRLKNEMYIVAERALEYLVNFTDGDENEHIHGAQSHLFDAQRLNCIAICDMCPKKDKSLCYGYFGYDDLLDERRCTYL